MPISNTYGTNAPIEEYVAGNGVSPFGGWFDGLDAVTAARVVVGVTRLEAGNFANAKGVGAGV